MILRLLGLVSAALLLTGCQRAPQNGEAAVRQAVPDYLSQRTDLNLSQMEIDVTSVAINGNQAEATAAIQPRNAPPGSPPMEIRYTLERQGDRWAVKGRAAGQEGHGMGAAPGQTQPLPPGHPPTGEQSTGRPE